MQNAIRVWFSPSLYTPDTIASAASIVNAMSPLEFRAGALSYAAAVDFHYRGSDPQIRQAVIDGGEALRLACRRCGVGNVLTDFQVHVENTHAWNVHLSFWRNGPMPEMKNTVLMVDASPWIREVEALFNQLHTDTGIAVPVELVLTDVVDTIIGFQSRPLTMDSVDYFLQCMEERDFFFASTEPKMASAMLMEDRVTDTVREACGCIGPHIEQIVHMVHERRRSHTDDWVAYRVADNRFVIEVGDGSQSVHNRNFSVPTNIRRENRLEESWVYGSDPAGTTGRRDPF